MSFYSNTNDQHIASFKALTNEENVAAMLSLPLGKLKYFAFNRSAKTYTIFRIPKAAGGFREITAPIAELREVQRRLMRIMEIVYHPREVVHGFRKARSSVTNAREHIGARWILNVDLENFFPSIGFGRVRGMLMAHPYYVKEQAATLIAALCCYQRCLPQGAPTSPVLANMICARLDTELRAYASLNRCRYSRYADDITLSTRKSRFPGAVAARGAHSPVNVGEQLRNIISKNGFTINDKKSRLSHYSERQEVTGLVTNRIVNVPREFVRELRAMMHAWTKFGEDEAQADFLRRRSDISFNPSQTIFRDVILGKLSYLAMVKGRDDSVYVRLVRRGRSRIDDSFSTDVFYKLPIPEDAVVVLEGFDRSGMPSGQGTGFFLEGVGLVTCAHAVAHEMIAFRWHHPAHRCQVSVLQQHDDWDVAILKSGMKARYELRRGSTAQLEAGSRVRVLGFPNWANGRPLAVTDALIQGEHAGQFGARRLSINSAIFGGNSGGPVVNAAGEVVGIALKGMFQDKGGTENMFIPIDYVFSLRALGGSVIL